jgi:hypothetical protein
MDYLLRLWEGLPWWVGLLVLVFLAAYALVRAGFELWKEEELARGKAETQLQATEEEQKDLTMRLQDTKRECERPVTGLHKAEQERDELRSENEKLLAEASLVSAWDDTELKFTNVNKKKFRNESVPLDGFLYTNCTFENVTFVYKGEEPYGLVAYKVLGKDTGLKTEGAPLWAYSRLLNILGYVKQEIEKGDELRPDATSVRIEDGTVEIFESKEEEDQRIRMENEQLKAERDALSEEERRILQDHRRLRIEEWRSLIRNFDFDAERFSSTDAYSQMRPHLQRDVKRKLEHPGMFIAGNATRGEHAHRYMLLDEIARIEKEWGLV